MNGKYILVEWPEIQDYMDHPRYNECFSATRIDETDINSYWFVPEDIILSKIENYNSYEK